MPVIVPFVPEHGPPERPPRKATILTPTHGGSPRPVGSLKSTYDVARSSLGASITVSGTAGGNGKDSLIADNKETGGRHDFTAKKDQSFTIDLGRSYWLDGFECQSNGAPFDMPLAGIYTAPESVVYDLQWVGSVVPNTVGNHYVAFPKPVYARYVHMISHIDNVGAGSQNWVLWWVKVFATTPLKLRNPRAALLKPNYGTLSQSSGGAQNSIHRQSTTGYGRWDFSGTANGQWVQIDYPTPRRVVRIWYTSATGSFGPPNFSVDYHNGSAWVPAAAFANGSSGFIDIPRWNNRWATWRLLNVGGTAGGNWVYFNFLTYSDPREID